MTDARTLARAVRRLCALPLVVASVNHGAKVLAHDGPTLRHAAFVVINAVAAGLVVFAPRRALLPLALLTVQQLYSHGTDLVISVRGSGPFDVASLGVVLFFPILLSALVVERRTGTRAPPPGGRPGS